MNHHWLVLLAGISGRSVRFDSNENVRVKIDRVLNGSTVFDELVSGLPKFSVYAALFGSQSCDCFPVFRSEHLKLNLQMFT